MVKSLRVEMELMRDRGSTCVDLKIPAPSRQRRTSCLSTSASSLRLLLVVLVLHLRHLATTAFLLPLDTTSRGTPRQRLGPEVPSTSRILVRHNKRSTNKFVLFSSIIQINNNPREEEESSRLTETAKSNTTTSSSYYIPPEQLDALRDAVNIVDVVEQLQVAQFQKRSDLKAVALCPFHDDHTPSLQIDGQRGLFKCFACGAGGNVYNFVKEYHNLDSSSGDEMNFVQAVKYVRDNFAPSFSLPLDGNSQKSRRRSPEERAALQQQTNRILLANALAADFYATQLASPARGGKARRHLQERGILPLTVQQFGIGYAPDCYYGSNSSNNSWGQGSLVQYLQEQGLTPNEIMAAGLATRIQSKQQLPSQQPLQDPSATGNSMFSSALNQTTKATNATASATTEEDKGDDMDYSKLMDRFRGRLVVPIFDTTGKQVLGFGGRILDDTTDDDDDSVQRKKKFQPPKYLNSPESLVFTKKNVLFGYHMVDRALPKIRKSIVPEKEPSMATVVIVEGYMDAIALWQADITEAVACMGTALTSDQLEAAAKLVRSRGGGRVVLCLDNDTAGINAIERLCSGNMLSSIAERHSIEFVVATLPDGVKDPAEFVEKYPFGMKPKQKDTVAGYFKQMVEETAQDWIEWYIDRIMSQYDASAVRGAPGSFGNVFEKVAEFLATFSNAAERIKRASAVSILFSEIMAKENGTPTVSESVRVQLEADLVDKASRMAKSRDSVARRLEEITGAGSEAEIQGKLASIAQGEGLAGPDETDKLSFKKRMEDPEFQADVKKKRASKVRKTSSKGQRRYKVKKKPEPKTLTPHFNGFGFAYDSDAVWLGVPSQQWKRNKGSALRLKGESDPYTAGSENPRNSGAPVYFNSNDYHGENFLSVDAAKAGYAGAMAVPRDPELFEKGVGTLLQHNADVVSETAENILLRTLIAFGSARNALKNSRDVSEASGNIGTITWKNPAREWLFTKLVDEVQHLPEDLSGPESIMQLRTYLADCSDVPDGAFGSFRVKENQDVPDIVQASSSDATATVDPPARAVESPKVKSFVSADGMDVPEDISEIDDWAASFDPSIFDEPIQDKGAAPIDQKDDSVHSSDTVPIKKDDIVKGEGVVETVAVTEITPQESHFVDDEADLSGSLDSLFLLEEDSVLTVDFPDGVPPEDRAALSVQEMYTTLQWTTAVRRLARIKEKLAEAAGKLIDSSTTEANPADDAKEGGKPELNRDELVAYCDNLNRELEDCTAAVQVLTDSAKRISQRLVQCAATNGITENRISEAQFNNLRKTVDTHLNEIHQWSLPDPDQLEDDSYEDYLERAQKEWGDMYEDTRLWSVDDIVHESPPLEIDPEKMENLPGFEYLFQDAEEEASDESFEDTIDRMDREWAQWLDDDDDDDDDDNDGAEEDIVEEEQLHNR